MCAAYLIVNIKAHSFFPTRLLKLENNLFNFAVSKKKRSFFVLRSSELSYVIIVFKSLVNVTGIKNLKDLPDVEHMLRVLFNVERAKLIIDNLTVKICFEFLPRGEILFLPGLLDFARLHSKKYNIKSVRFDPEIFSGLFIRFSEKKFGTLLIFKTYSVMLVGCNSEKDVSHSSKVVFEILKAFTSTPLQHVL